MTRFARISAALGLAMATAAAVFLAPLSATAVPGVGVTQLVDITTTGVASTDSQSNDSPSVSADGRFVVFASAAPDLFGGKAGSWEEPVQVYIRDTVLNTTRALNTTGTTVGTDPVISDDGMLVAYISDQAYLWSAATGRSTVVSRDYLSAPVNAAVTSVDLSGTGNAVVYTTAATNVLKGDPYFEPRSRAYKVDLNTGETLLAQSDAMVTAEGATVSDDGRFVAFTSTDDHTTVHTHGTRQAYVRDTVVSNLMELISVNASGTGAGNGDVLNAQISGDGQYVAFASSATDLTSSALTRAWHVFVRDRNVSKTSVESRDVSGNVVAAVSPAISANGLIVAYQAIGVAPASSQVLVMNRLAGKADLVSRSRSGGEGNWDSFSVALSSSGQFAAWTTMATDLTPDRYPSGTLHEPHHTMLRNLGSTYVPLPDVLW